MIFMHAFPLPMLCVGTRNQGGVPPSCNQSLSTCCICLLNSVKQYGFAITPLKP